MNKKISFILLIVMLFTSCAEKEGVSNQEIDIPKIEMKDINIIQLVRFVEDEREPSILELKKLIKEDDKDEEKESRPIIKDIPLEEPLLEYIWHKSLENDIAYSLALAIIGVESDYGRATLNRNKNGTVDSGISQINSTNIKFLSELAGIDKVDPQNDYHSVDMMFELLKYERGYWREKEYSGEEVFVLLCLSYNMGRGNSINYVKKNGVKANGYAKKVLSIKNDIESKIY